MLILSRKIGRRILIGPVGNPSMTVTPVDVCRTRAGIEINGEIHNLGLEVTVQLHDGIAVTLLGTSGRTARLGVDAPRDVPIHREEVCERIQAEQREAAARRRDAAFGRKVGELA